LQRSIEAVLANLNERYESEIIAKFVVTAGDEFQGLLCNATILPDIVWDLEDGLRQVDVRIGIGCGVLDTGLREYAVGMDGPVWHHARDAVSLARRRPGGVFVGFGADGDSLLNGFARLLRLLRQRLAPVQRRTLSILRREPTLAGTDLAARYRISRQAANKTMRSAGWNAFHEGEEAWRVALKPFDYCRHWRQRK